MLTIKKINHRYTLACITIAPDMTPDDRARLALLAGILRGRHANNPEAYHFTGARGEKCWALFNAGFSVVPKVKYHWQDRAFIHPAYAKRVHLSAAMTIARVAAHVREAANL